MTKIKNSKPKPMTDLFLFIAMQKMREEMDYADRMDRHLRRNLNEQTGISKNTGVGRKKNRRS